MPSDSSRVNTSEQQTIKGKGNEDCPPPPQSRTGHLLDKIIYPLASYVLEQEFTTLVRQKQLQKPAHGN